MTEKWKNDSSVSAVMSLRAGCPRNCGSNSGKCIIFLLHIQHPGTLVPIVPHIEFISAVFSEGKCGRGVMLTIHLTWRLGYACMVLYLLSTNVVS